MGDPQTSFPLWLREVEALLEQRDPDRRDTVDPRSCRANWQSGQSPQDFLAKNFPPTLRAAATPVATGKSTNSKLMPCVACGRMISHYAYTCPHCGKPVTLWQRPPEAQMLYGCLMFILVALGIAYFFVSHLHPQ